MRRIRAVFGAAGLLLTRRLRRDALLVAVWTLLVATVVAISVLSPRLVVGMLDGGAREAVAAAGHDGDLLVEAPVGTRPPGATVAVIPGDEIAGVADGLQRDLPAGLASVVGPTALTIVSTVTVGTTVGDSADRSRLRLGLLTPDVSEGTVLSSGRLPDIAGADGAVEVVVSTAAASLAGLTLGSEVVTGDTRLRVVGTVTRAEGADPNPDLPGLWDPSDDAGAGVSVVALADPGALSTAERGWDEPFTAFMRIPMDVGAFTAASVPIVSEETRALEVNSSPLVAGSGYDLAVSSGFADALKYFPDAERAARAQSTMFIIGVLGVSTLVVLLVSGLLVRRRDQEIKLERVRGSSASAVVVRSLAEALLVGAVGVAVGLAASWWAVPGEILDPLLLCAVVAPSLLGAPVGTVLMLRRDARARRDGRDRRSRAERVRLAQARRLSVEATVVIVAALATLAATGRGLLQQQTDGTDLLLAASPLLLVAVVTVVLLRVQRWPVALAAKAARGARGAFGLLSAAHAERSSAALPLLALTLALGIAVGDVSLAATVSAGQVDASWQRIGADVRMDGTVAASELTRVATAPDISAASAVRALPGVKLDLGTTSSLATVLAVDDGYAGLVEHLPELPDVAGQADAGPLHDLDTVEGDGSVPVVVDETLAERLPASALSAAIDGISIPLHVIGTVRAGPGGYLDGPFLYADIDALSAHLASPLQANSLLVVGPGADDAVPAANGEPSESRADWLDHQRGRALVAGIRVGSDAATLAVLVLGVIGLVATCLAGARERARSQALVRTLGAPRMLAALTSAAETLPLVVGSVVGGVVAGYAVSWILGPALGLDVLSGGTTEPPAVIPPGAALGALVVGAFLVAVLAMTDLVAARRARLSDVLRVGDSR